LIDFASAVATKTPVAAGNVMEQEYQIQHNGNHQIDQCDNPDDEGEEHAK